MSSRPVRVFAMLPLACALATLALADTQPPAAARAAPAATVPEQSRATIRGTGKDVSIVYRGASTSSTPRRQPGFEAAPVEPVLAEAARLASRGADDLSLIAYLRTHQAELPPIVGADSVRRLRKAGAGATVAAELSRLTAVDIGDTGEGAAPQEPFYGGPAEPAEPPTFYTDGYAVYANSSFGPPRRAHIDHFHARRGNPPRPVQRPPGIVRGHGIAPPNAGMSRFPPQ